MSADDLIALLDAIGKTTFERPSGGADEDVRALVEEYPGIAGHTEYLELLRATGGTYTENDEIDLGLYGFDGEGVASFEEGNFLDRDRYFLFGELMALRGDGESRLLAFDTTTGDVLSTTEDLDSYSPAAGSFRELLERLARRDYPPSVRNVSE